MRAFQHPPVAELTLERLLHARVGVATCGELDAGRPKSSMSHHFRILRDAGLVHTRPEGTVHQNTLRQADLETRFPGLLQAVLAQAVTAEETDAAG